MNTTKDAVLRQAARIDCLLPTILRRICTLDGPRIDLPVAQLRLCTLLMNEPMTMSSLSRELGTTVSATTQLADRLESIGFVERITEPGDRRTRCLRLTPQGVEVMQKSRDERRQRWAEILGRLPERTRSQLLEILDMLAAASIEAFPMSEGGTEALAGRAAEILLQVEQSS